MWLWSILLEKIPDATQAKSVLRWIGAILMAVALALIASGLLLFHHIWPSFVPLFMGLVGFELYRGQIRRSSIRVIILLSALCLALSIPATVSTWTASTYSALRLLASLGMILSTAVFLLGLRARQAARIIEPPSAAPWWLP